MKKQFLNAVVILLSAWLVLYILEDMRVFTLFNVKVVPLAILIVFQGVSLVFLSQEVNKNKKKSNE